MPVYITNIHGLSSEDPYQQEQNLITKWAMDPLGYYQIGLYYFDGAAHEAKELQNSRFDGIIAPLTNNDTLIFQSPSWNTIAWDRALMDHLQAYSFKRIIEIEACPPLMSQKWSSLLPAYIDYYNQADALIAPSQKMITFLKARGLKDKPYVLQKMWDHPSPFGNYSGSKNKVINFIATRPETFIDQWSDPQINLLVYNNQNQSVQNQQVHTFPYQEDVDLLLNLRHHGGFGLVWSEDPSWQHYLSMSASFALSTFLAAGLPVIVPTTNSNQELIKKKKLGLVVNSLAEAKEKVNKVSPQDYQEMTHNVAEFGQLIRDGYFTKRSLTEAVFQSRFA